LVAFDAVDSPFASWGFNWSLPTSISIESPVTVRIPTDNGTLMNAALPPITAVLDYFWTDNLPAHLKGHIAPTIPARTPFLTGNSGRHYTRVTLNFPDDLPEGFRGRLDTVMRDESGETIYVASTQHFAKDHTPPNVVAIHSERTETELEVSATVNDPPTGIGQVRVTPSVAGVPGRPEYLRYVAGDFFEDTQMRSRFDALRPRDRVELELVASDGNNNQVTLADLPVANTGGDRTVECRSARGRAVQLDARRSTIPEGASVTWSGPFGTLDGRRERVRLPLGTTSINLTIEDERGFTSSQTSNVTVRDTRPPRIDRDRPLCFDARRREVPPLRVIRSGTGGEHQSGYVVIRAERDLAPRVEDRCDRHPDVLISDVSLRARDHRRRSQDAGAVVFADHVCIPIERHPRAREIEVLLRDASGNERSAEFVVDPDARHCDRLRHPEVVDVNNPVCSASSLRRSSDISSKEQSPGSTERESSCALERAGGRGGASALLALVVVSMAAGARRRRRLGAVNAELSR
jgi:hypothetical protein